MVEGNIHIVAAAVDRISKGLDGIGVEDDFIDRGGFAQVKSVKVSAWKSVGNTIGTKNEIIVIENRIGLIARGIDSVSKIDWSGPSVSVPERAPKVVSSKTYFTFGCEYHHFSVSREGGVAYIALPSVNVNATYFTELTRGVGVEVGDAVGIATGEV